MATKKIIEKKTGEVYASKKAMAKHEKGESKATQKKEAMKGASPMKQMAASKTAATTKPKATPVKGKPLPPTKMKKY